MGSSSQLLLEAPTEGLAPSESVEALAGDYFAQFEAFLRTQKNTMNPGELRKHEAALELCRARSLQNQSQCSLMGIEEENFEGEPEPRNHLACTYITRIYSPIKSNSSLRPFGIWTGS